MRGGELRHRLVIQERGDVRSALNEPDPDDWREVTQAWASVLVTGGNEASGTGMEVVEATGTLRIRYQPGIEPSQRARLVEGADVRVFEIESVTDPDGRRRELVLGVRELVGREAA